MNEQLTTQSLPFKFSLKNIILILLLLVGLYLLLPQLVGLEQALKLLVGINKFYLFLAIVVEIFSYISAAWLLGIIFSRMGHEISFLTRFRLGSMAAFTIHFLPIGTAGQATFDYYYLRKQQDVDAGSIVLMWILRLIFTYSGLLIIFLIGLVLVPTYPAMSVSPRIISFVLIALIATAVFYLIWLYRQKERSWKVLQKIFNIVNSILLKLKRTPIGNSKRQEIFDDIYNGIGLFGKKKRSSILAIIAATLYWLGDILCLFFVFAALGFPVKIGILFFSYCVATILGIISAVPGGIGITEGSLALILGGMGVPTAIALTATLVFRLFSFWIWIPIGFFSYLSLQKNRIS